MQSRNHSRFVSIVCICTLITSVRALEIDRSCFEELNTSGRKAWQEYRDALTGLRFEARLTRSTDDDPKTQQHSRFVYFRDADGKHEMLIYAREHPEAANGQVRSARNPRYGFQATYGSTVEANRLASADLLNSPNVPRSLAAGVGIAEALIRVSVPLEQLLDEGTIRILDLSRIKQPNAASGNAIRIEFEAARKGVIGGTVHGRQWCIIDPGRSYTLMRYGMTVPERKAQITTDLELQFSPEGVPFPKKITSRSELSGDKKKSLSVQEYVVSMPVKEALPISEFYLPHYGFSESVLPGYTNNHWHKWAYATAGVIGLIIAYKLYRWRRSPEGGMLA